MQDKSSFSKYTKVSPQEKIEIHDLYRKNLSISQISRQSGRITRTVKRVLTDEFGKDCLFSGERSIHSPDKGLTRSILSSLQKIPSGYSFKAVQVAKVLGVRASNLYAITKNKGIRSWDSAKNNLANYSQQDYQLDSQTKTDREISESLGVRDLYRWKKRNGVEVKQRNRYPRDLPINEDVIDLFKEYKRNFRYYPMCEEGLLSDQLLRACCICIYRGDTAIDAQKYITSTLKKTAQRSYAALKSVIQTDSVRTLN